MIRRPPEFTRTDTLFPPTTRVRSAQAATCNPATPQVDAFDLRGIDKNLEHRPRRRQLRHFARIKLDRHIALELAVSTVLEVIGAQRRAHHRGIGAQHTVTVERRHRVERSEEHTSELQSLMRISYAVFCLQKKTQT